LDLKPLIFSRLTVPPVLVNGLIDEKNDLLAGGANSPKAITMPSAAKIKRPVWAKTGIY